MSKEDRDEEFWGMTDEFIKIANEQCDSHRNGKVSTAMLFSAARFNAFMFASSSKDMEEYVKDKELAVEFFTKQYEEALRENIKDYEKNYKDYVANK